MEPRIQYAKTKDGVSIAYPVPTSWIRRFDEWTIANRESLMPGTRQVIAKAIQGQEGP